MGTVTAVDGSKLSIKASNAGSLKSGETVRVNRVPMTVVGLLESKGSSFGNDNDDLIILPSTP